ncbi:RA-domain-containing protein [Viridothelium virens]|uniref:RA-domain-containing protein n=1 Tax=Viridothelium virens TaxID=1048519 RepID=A0A6A6H5L6_VIRVR|nr:RA-domain-containing protein [Viridothelium virens]
MAYRSAYHEDSDADDEFERSVVASPTLPPDFESSPTDSDPPSAENTPTTYTHSDSHISPNGLISQWTATQCADFVSSLGLRQYADTIVEEGVNGEALIALHHAELKEMGMASVGHRLKVLRNVYEIKVKQNIPLDPEDFVPPSAEASSQDATATQDDIARIIESIKLRDERIIQAETELKMLKEDMNRVLEENRRLREDFLPALRMYKDRSHPLPNPDGQNQDNMSSPPLSNQTDRGPSSLSRKFSTKKLFLGSAPKNPSPTIHEGRTLNDGSNLHPSAAAVAASNDLTASFGGSQTSPNTLDQRSPTSPAYSTQTATTARSFRGDKYGDDSYADRDRDRVNGNRSRSNADEPPNSGNTITSSAASTTSTIIPPNSSTANTLASLADRSKDSSSLTSVAPSTSSSTTAIGAPPNSATSNASGSSSNNPQVEIYKSFRVSVDDPCYKVLPVALKKYNITADWRQYALYIVHGDQERCLGLQEKPLILFKQLDREGRKPMFMLRRHASPQVGHENYIGGAHRDGSQAGGSVSLPGGVL